jgi:CDP-glucose 4,6-dehydratase
MFENVFQGKRVYVTGHTGFKGAWFCEWLLKLGAQVRGYALPPDTPALFTQLALAPRIEHVEADVRDLDKLQKDIAGYRPDFLFHMAAQSLVRVSYREPIETYSSNVMGTVHVLEALRRIGKPLTCVIVTTDKCYENKNTPVGYREVDTLGGADPYSSSKAMAELAVTAYRQSYKFTENGIRVATARAGNVVGGGDWASDRLVPDCIRSLARGEMITIRNPNSTRPWQHVLDALSGYLKLASAMHSATPDRVDTLCDAFNFGPASESNCKVSEVVQQIVEVWPGKWTTRQEDNPPHEAILLQLAIDKARQVLGWQPTWELKTTIRRTVEWYRGAHEGKSPQAMTASQLDEFASQSHG